MATLFRCDLSETTGTLSHFWQNIVGSGHATLGIRTDWQRQLRQCHAELGFKYVRFHGLLDDDMGVLVTEEGKHLYSYFNIDQIFDFLISIGMKPFVELSFMPTALATGQQTVFKYRGNVTPPRDYGKWAGLIKKLLEHWIARYGVEEVKTWFFEVWNEPNEGSFWAADQAEYFKLYQTTAHAIKDVDSLLRVGGPATAMDAWITEFLDFCQSRQVPVDFVSTHHYPTDAVGSADDDTLSQLAHSRRGILRQWAQDSARKSRGKPLYYTEWNTSSNPRDPLHDEPYAAACITKTMMEANGLADGYSFWTFTDIFEENYFPATAFQGGFGLLTVQGIAKPSYRAFQILHGLGTKLCLVDGLHPTVDAWVVRGSGHDSVLMTNIALPRHPLESQTVRVQLVGASRPESVIVERIDEGHANPKRRWHDMGKPPDPSPVEVEELNEESKLAQEPLGWTFDSGTLGFELTLPPRSVANVVISYKSHSEKGDKHREPTAS